MSIILSYPPPGSRLDSLVSDLDDEISINTEDPPSRSQRLIPGPPDTPARDCKTSPIIGQRVSHQAPIGTGGCSEGPSGKLSMSQDGVSQPCRPEAHALLDPCSFLLHLYRQMQIALCLLFANLEWPRHRMMSSVGACEGVSEPSLDSVKDDRVALASKLKTQIDSISHSTYNHLNRDSRLERPGIRCPNHTQLLQRSTENAAWLRKQWSPSRQYSLGGRKQLSPGLTTAPSFVALPNSPSTTFTSAVSNSSKVVA
ncbi:hypothetical protein CC78DRAFT_586086 [Lojkania enalia]|uniref:Uncharacterized protein n=1 Tax=Lojkania enalia TaxID=147567 RepID=A0A9P4K236_9PLEO|nr:hypothetical protein CC78DRAFT_586086 [Didymosphaeria enalia]